MCFGCSKEPSHRGGSFEYPQQMFWLRNKKKIIVSYALLTEEHNKLWSSTRENLHMGFATRKDLIQAAQL